MTDPEPCFHDESEKDTALADGYCPLCLVERIAELEALHAEIHADYDRLQRVLAKERQRIAELEARASIGADIAQIVADRDTDDD